MRSVQGSENAARPVAANQSSRFAETSKTMESQKKDRKVKFKILMQKLNLLSKWGNKIKQRRIWKDQFDNMNFTVTYPAM